MRYLVRGVWKLSGDVALVRLSAEDEEAARRYADAVGIITMEVTVEAAVREEPPGLVCDRRGIAV